MRGTASFDVLRVVIGSGARLWSVGRTQKRSQVNIFDAQFRTYGK